MTIPPTPKQQRVLDFIRSYLFEHEYAPSYEEIQRRFAFGSLASVHRIVKALERRGWIAQEKGLKRSLHLVGGQCPSCGRDIHRPRPYRQRQVKQDVLSKEV